MSVFVHSRGGGGKGPARTATVLVTLAVAALSGLLITRAAPGAPPTADTLPAQHDTASITSSISLPAPGASEILPAVDHPFKRGESLKFAVQYGFIRAGTAWLEVPEIRDWSGHPVYHLQARAESNSFFSRFYKVRNRIDSYWDKNGFFSWRYAEDRREGGNHYSDEIVFDHDRGEAHYKNGTSYPIPPRVQDALSAFYYTRTQALPVGGSIVFDYHASKKSTPLQVKILGRETVETPAGRFDCIAIEPVLNAGGIFKNQGRLVIWLTDDERRMPVLMKSRVSVGSISVVLVDVRSGA